MLKEKMLLSLIFLSCLSVSNDNIALTNTTLVEQPDNISYRTVSSIPGSCTIFCISHDGAVFFGNNEDWINPNTYYWVKPSTDSTYGVLYFGYDDFGPQGGINEKGLAFDGNALPYIKINTHPEKRKATEAIVNNIIMQKCASVEEAIEMARSYDWGYLYSDKFAGQYLLADSTGDAAVIGFNRNGELAVTRKNKGNGYLVSTNFNRAFPENRYYSYPCNRYATTSNLLEKINNHEEDLTLDYLSSVLNAVHEEGRRINTLYSNIFDLRNKIVYFYYWHNFDYTCELNVAEVISNVQKPKRIKDLFPLKVTNKADDEYYMYKILPVLIISSICWLALVTLSEIILWRKKIKYLSLYKKCFWIIIILFIGPFGLLWLIINTKITKNAGT
jgi:hypothetical protein